MNQRLWITLSLGAFLGTSTVQAEEWSFQLTPYVWTAGIDGDVGVGPLVAEVDHDFSDLVEDLEWGASLGIEARKNAGFILGEVFYSEFGSSFTGPLGAQRGIDLDSLIASLVVGYQVLDEPRVETFVGARYFSLDVEGRETLDRSEDWVDPLVGMRLVQSVSDPLDFVLLADIGGFGASSDLTWSVLPALSYQFSEQVAGKFGYRFMGVDYEDDGFVYDVDYTGLFLGAGIEF